MNIVYANTVAILFLVVAIVLFAMGHPVAGGWCIFLAAVGAVKPKE